MPKRSKFCYEGNRIRIRKLRPSDAKDIYENMQDREIYRWTTNISRPYTIEHAERFVKKANYYLKRGKRYAFGIALKDSDKVVGIVDLFRVDRMHRNAELGYWLGKKYRAKGLMGEAIKLMLDFGFKKLKLHRIYANVFEGNIASKKVLEGAGFRYEGTSREAVFKSGRWRNCWRFALLKDEFQEWHASKSFQRMPKDALQKQ